MGRGARGEGPAACEAAAVTGEAVAVAMTRETRSPQPHRGYVRRRAGQRAAGCRRRHINWTLLYSFEPMHGVLL